MSDRDVILSIGAFKLDLLQPVKLILFQNMFTFQTFILGLPFLIAPEIRRKERSSKDSGNGENGKGDNECDTGVSVLGTFKLNPLHPVKLILFQKISTFQTLILGLPFLITRAYDMKRSREEGVEMRRLNEATSTERNFFYLFIKPLISKPNLT